VSINKGRRHSKEVNKKKSLSGVKNGMYGKKHSEATKQLMREHSVGKNKGIPKSEKHKSNISKARIGVIPWHKKIEYNGEIWIAKDLTKHLNVSYVELKELLNLKTRSDS
jgi:ABC-type lipoprotein release transport system permease subunit